MRGVVAGDRRGGGAAHRRGARLRHGDKPDEREATPAAILPALRLDTIALAAEIASLPEGIPGYGPTKERSIVAARQRRDELIQAMKASA